MTPDNPDTKLLGVLHGVDDKTVESDAAPSQQTSANEAVSGEVLPDAPSLDATYTDSGNGSRFAEIHRDRFRYLPKRKRWIWWSGGRWADTHDGDLLRAAQEVPRQLLAQAQYAIDEESRKAKVMFALKSWAARLEARSRWPPACRRW
jgi:hypothetical protein